MNNIGSSVVNSYVYKAPGGYVMIDTGYKTGYSQLKKKLKKAGLSIGDVSYVFLTHTHDDHAGALGYILRDNPSIKAIVHQNAVEGLKRGQNNTDGKCTSGRSLRFSKLMNALKKDHGFPTIGDDQQARLLVMSSENIVEIGSLLGGMMIETPGHTPDSVSLLLEDGTLLCGDTLMNGYPSQHCIPILAEDKDALIASWQQLIQAQPKLVLPGHGKPFCGKAVSDNLQHLKAMRLRTLYTK